MQHIGKNTVIERYIKMYNKFVPELKILDFAYAKLTEIAFPGMKIENLALETGSRLPLVPAIPGKTEEVGIIITHHSDVFETISIWVRALNFGQSTMIGLYKLSDYEPPKMIMVSEKGCCGPKMVQKVNGHWIRTDKNKILAGTLVENQFGRQGNHYKSPEEVLTRYELFNAFYFITDKVLIPAIEEYVEQY